MACCVCNRNRGLCKGCACVKAGCTCFNCLPGRDGHCFNFLGSSEEASAFPGPVTPVETVPSSSMARSSLLQPLELLSVSSLPGDSHSPREDMPCGESVSVACVGRLPLLVVRHLGSSHHLVTRARMTLIIHMSSLTSVQ